MCQISQLLTLFWCLEHHRVSWNLRKSWIISWKSDGVQWSKGSNISEPLVKRFKAFFFYKQVLITKQSQSQFLKIRSLLLYTYGVNKRRLFRFILFLRDMVQIKLFTSKKKNGSINKGASLWEFVLLNKVNDSLENQRKLGNSWRPEDWKSLNS